MSRLIWPIFLRASNSLKAQAAAAYGQLAYIDLFFKNPQQALKSATTALILAPGESWIAVNLVHAYVFNGKVDQAIQLCRRHQKSMVGDKPFHQVVLDDFKEFNKRGMNPAGMKVLQQRLTQDLPG